MPFRIAREVLKISSVTAKRTMNGRSCLPGTILRFYCDGMMFEITPGAPTPEEDPCDRECRRETNEPENDFYADEHDSSTEEDDGNMPF